MSDYRKAIQINAQPEAVFEALTTHRRYDGRIASRSEKLVRSHGANRARFPADTATPRHRDTATETATVSPRGRGASHDLPPGPTWAAGSTTALERDHSARRM
jgi:hypothetical protein